ncbi:MAG: hypothetical protein IPK60_18190 [Sandaracinaceae bacterium]|nr:hypothetical protein [Sandaracinaceae bacterium]
MPRRSVLSLAFVFCALGCQGQGIDAANFCAEYISIFCSANQSCCTTPTDVYPGTSSCETARNDGCSLGTGAAFTDGRATFNSGVAAQILIEARNAAATCASLPPLWAYDLVRGSIPVGEDCSPVGADYSPTFACNYGSVCVLTGTPGIGLAGRCVASGYEGSPCNAETCGAGLYCDFGTGFGSCTLKRNDGFPCTSAAQCVAGVCFSSLCGQGTTSTAYCVPGAQTTL